MFLDAARMLPDYAFVWIGGDPGHTAEELHRLYEVPSNAYLLGDVLGASNYIALCDLFVLFSNFEGLPMTIIEAMSQKKAVVASDVGGIYELVDETNGALIENDAERACQAIQRILSDEDLRKSMEEKSYEKYRSSFTLEKMWGGYKSMYENVISQGSKQ